MAGGAQLISVYPEELSFQFELDKPITCDLKLVNNTKHHVAFKVKTTSPKKYFVRPNTGVIQPWDNAVITVTLQAQREYPPDMQCKDKFLLQSTKVPPSTDIDEMPPETFNKDGDKIIEECKLRVVYTSGHSDQGNSETDTLPTSSMSRGSKQDSDADLMHSSSYEEVHALQLARQQRESALQETKQLQHELAILKQHRNQKADAGFSLTFAAIIGLTGIVLGFLLNLALYSPHTV